MNTPLESLLPQPDFDDKDRNLSAKKIYYQTHLNLIQASFESALRSKETEETEELKSELAHLAAIWDHEYALDEAIHNAYVEVAKNQVGERTNRADFVQKTAAAISAVYVGVLGLTYSVKDGVALPARGFTPALFLGLAIFLSAVYASFLTDSGEMEAPESEEDLSDVGKLQPIRLHTYIRWTSLPVLKRKFMLQAAVTSLGFGTLFLPLAYLSIPDFYGLIAAGIGLVGTFVAPYILGRSFNRKTSS